MITLETYKSQRLIPQAIFNICLIDNLSLEQICLMYSRNQFTGHKRNTCYKLDKFIMHLEKVHNITIQDYLEKYFNFEWPICPGKGIKVGYKVVGRGLILSDYVNGGITRQNCKAFDEGCKKLSEQRKGSGNPMYGREGWSKGLTKETSETLRIRGEKQRGKDNSTPYSREKSRQRLLGKPGMHCTPHSEETKEKLRIHTAGLWARGVFNKISSIHIKMREFLSELSLKEQFVEEFQVKYFSMDFAFPEHKIAVEVQGGFYHVDPRLYPNGPINAIQRRNYGRDKAKRKVCCDQEGWIIIEAWETEINDGTFKEQIKCKLKELNLLN